jgi:single-strand DNA-binding protein
MSDTNHVVLIGRLVRGSELKYTPGGKIVSTFSIAVNKRWKTDGETKEATGFFDIILWGKIGENLRPYLTQGKQICVTGELNQHRWSQNGQNHSKVYVNASTIQLLGGGQHNGAGPQGVVPTGGPVNAADPQDEGLIEDIPF